jgi:predicted RNA binding protein YcfA (HicA-like mRNA interferase family)
MPKLPRVTAKKVLAILLRARFYVHHQTGSHVNLRHTSKANLRVVVPMHGRELSPKTVKSIIVQSEMTVEEFLRLL